MTKSIGRKARRFDKSRRGNQRLFCRLKGEVLEDRLALSWTGVPPAVVAVPSSPTAVAFNSQQDAQGAAAISANEVDYYSFVAPATGTYRLTATTPASSVDTVLGLFSAAGQRLAYNDDVGTSTDSQVAVSLSAGIRYYIGITNYTGSPNGSYNWFIDGPAPAMADDGYEQNDTINTATNLGTLTSTATLANLVMADGHDWYRFQTASTGTAGNSVTINFQHAQGDLDMELYNASGVRLATSTSASNQEQISLANRLAGVYYLHVYGYQGAANPNYSLTVTPPGGSPPPTSTIDLSGASLNATDAAQWGQTISVQSLIRNTGNTASGSFQVQWYLSRDPSGSSDDILLSLASGGTSFNHGPIAANGFDVSFATNLQLPAALPAGWSGSSFYIVMKTDSANQIAETNESNNFGQLGNGIDRDPISITTATTPPPAMGGFHIDVVASGMTPNQIAIFQQGADRWAQIIVGDLPDANYNGRIVDDLLIDATGAAIDGSGGILGQAGPDRFRSGTSIPYHGSMEFDTADLASMEANGTLLGVIEHEMGHVLGIGTIWQSRGLLSGAGTSNPRFIGAQATAAYNQIFGVSENGVPVENSGGAGTRDSHWRESILRSELMTGFVGPGSFMPLSRITAASLADLGYQVNMAAADPFTPSLTSSLVASASLTSSPDGRSSTDNIYTLLRQASSVDVTASFASDVSSAIVPLSRSETPIVANSASRPSDTPAGTSSRSAYERAVDEVFASDERTQATDPIWDDSSSLDLGLRLDLALV